MRQRPGLQDATVGRASPAAGGIPLPQNEVMGYGQ
nr:MAG TPA: hypothetical protein [Caudoviricetes sp.]